MISLQSQNHLSQQNQISIKMITQDSLYSWILMSQKVQISTSVAELVGTKFSPDVSLRKIKKAQVVTELNAVRNLKTQKILWKCESILHFVHFHFKSQNFSEYLQGLCEPCPPPFHFFFLFSFLYRFFPLCSSFHFSKITPYWFSLVLFPSLFFF